MADALQVLGVLLVLMEDGLDELLAIGNDVTALQETDVLESDVAWLRPKPKPMDLP